MALLRRVAAFVAARAGREQPLTTSMMTEPNTAQADRSFLPGPVLLLGAPGVGKGTQAQLLMAKFGIPQISTGDILRANIADGTDLGKQAKDVISRGGLVSDHIVNKMVAERIKQPDTARGFILDGFPRTLQQAIWLDAFLSSNEADSTESKKAFLMRVAKGEAHKPSVVAISINVPYAELRRRITGRYTCPVCKSIYNIFSNPPKVADHCDLECAKLVQRPDDSEPVFVERMKTFESQTAPVVEHYRKQGRFEEIDGDQPVEQVTAAIEAALKRLRATKN
jgi:adenylate kinase